MTDRSVFRNGATVLVIGVCVTLISLVPSTVTTSVSRVIQNCLSLVFVFCFFFSDKNCRMFYAKQCVF